MITVPGGEADGGEVGGLGGVQGDGGGGVRDGGREQEGAAFGGTGEDLQHLWGGDLGEFPSGPTGRVVDEGVCREVGQGTDGSSVDGGDLVGLGGIREQRCGEQREGAGGAVRRGGDV